MDISKYFKWSG